MIPPQRSKSGRRHINIESEREVLYWSSRFNCSPEQLIAIVKRTGTSPIKVARELEKKAEAS